MNRALLVGINAYPGNELRGCINDVTDMADHLVKSCGFKVEDIRLLVDERATTVGIRERLEWLVGGMTWSSSGCRTPASRVIWRGRCCPGDAR